MIKDILKELRDFAGGLAAPDLCPVCGLELLEGERGVCVQCLMKLPRCITGSHTPLSDMLSNGIAPVGIAASWFRYNASAGRANLIRKAKYNDRPRLLRELGRQFARELAMASVPAGALPISAVDILLPVPMHWTKRLVRGFNQSREIALGISDETGIAVGDNLVAVAGHGTQTRRSSAGRRANMHGKLDVVYPQELDGLNIAFVDDIVTTGATIVECVRAVSHSGALPATLGVLSLAITDI